MQAHVQCPRGVRGERGGETGRETCKEWETDGQTDRERREGRGREGSACRGTWFVFFLSFLFFLCVPRRHTAQQTQLPWDAHGPLHTQGPHPPVPATPHQEGTTGQVTLTVQFSICPDSSSPVSTPALFPCQQLGWPGSSPSTTYRCDVDTLTATEGTGGTCREWRREPPTAHPWAQDPLHAAGKARSLPSAGP